MNLKTIVIDDEPLAVKLVAGYVEKTPFLELAGQFDNAVDAIDFLNNQEIDLIISDIQMPNLTGIELAKTIQEGPKIIFTTAYDQYAIEGFKVNAIDYLLKPFNYPEFLKAVNKAKKQFDLEHANAPAIESNNEFLFVKSEYKIRRINYGNILYIEGLKDYVKIHLASNEKAILSLISMKALEGKLPEERFMRVHRSFIVNLEKIETIERSRIIFGKEHIPVSEQYKNKFQDFVNKNFL